MSRFSWRIILAPAVSVVMRLAVTFVPTRSFRGFTLYSVAGEEALEILQRRLERAFTIIERFDPVRVRQINRYVRRYGIEKVGRDRFERNLHAHVTSLESLGVINDTDVALNMIHEATHARIEACGIRYTGANIPRIEHLCVRQEIKFGRLLPGDQTWLRRYETRLASEWWAPHHHWDDRRRRLMTLGYPKWLIRRMLGPRPSEAGGTERRRSL